MKGSDLNSYEPDILARDLDVIFCGVNPAMTAAVAGHNFSSRSNRFWTVLHLAGFPDVLLPPPHLRAPPQSLLDGAASRRLHRRPPSAGRGKAPSRVPMRPDGCRRTSD